MDAAPVPKRVRGRVLLLHFAVSLAVSMTLVAVVWPSWLYETPPPPLPDALGSLAWYLLLFALLAGSAWRSGRSLRALVGRPPDGSETRWAVSAGLALLAVSLASLYAVFLPLSHAAPDVVHWMLIENATVLIRTDGELHELSNLINLFVMVLLAPLVEELLFRGLLLPSWTSLWGSRRAVVASSAVFAVLHVEILGGFVFGVVTSLVFLRTRTLWLPITIHVTNNALVCLLAAGELAFYGDSAASLADLQSTWWLGLAGFLVGVPLLVVLLRRLPSLRPAAWP